MSYPLSMGILLQLLTTYFYAAALVGPSLPNYYQPEQVCVIKYADKNTPQDVTGVCSGVLVSPIHLLTAGHCLTDESESSGPVEVSCPNGERSTVAAQKLHENYMDAWIVGDSYRNFDLAVYILKTPLSQAPMAYAKTRQEAQQLLSTSSLCGLFGYGGRSPYEQNAFDLQTGYVHTPAVYFEQDILWLPALTGALSSLIVPGDSGGSFACLNEHQQWVHIAQNSGVSFSYESLLAPAYNATSLLPRHLSGPSEKQQINQLKQRLLRRLGNYQQVINKNKSYVTEARMSRTLGLKQQIEQANDSTTLSNLRQNLETKEQQEQDALNTQIASDTFYTVAPFTRIQKEPDFRVTVTLKAYSEQIPADIARYREHNHFNVGDNTANLFHVKSIENGRAYGDLIVRSVTSHYACIEFMICRPQKLHNVSVTLEHLKNNAKRPNPKNL